MSLAVSRALLILAWLVAAGLFACRQRDAFAAYDVQWAQDLAFFNQIFFAASQNRPWTSSLLLEPTGFFTMVHFHPIFAVILPIYALFPDPRTLQVINAVAVAAAAFPLAALGRAASGRAGFGLAAGLAWLCWFPTESAAGADFRAMALWSPGVALWLYGVFTRGRAALVVGAALVALSREESAYILGFFGVVLLVLPLGGRRRREGLLTLGLGVAWFVFLLLFKENFFFHFDPLHPPIGDPPPPELRAARLSWLGRSLLGSFGLAPLGPTPLALALAPLGYLWGDAQREWQLTTGPYVHLRSGLLPLCAAAGILGAAWAARRWPKLALPLTLWLALGNLLPVWPERAQLRELHRAHREALVGPEVQGIDALLRRVKPEDRVATDYRLIAALSGRRVLWNVRHLYLEDGRPPHWTAEWPMTLDRVDTVIIPPDDPIAARFDAAWAREAEGGGYALWRRVQPPEGGFPEPLP